ncbi:hypothetical protein Pan258_01300 [Symmachiella dynata]|uniref:hypothetical protein n=1 Tax=Symmachiella dynata TaxID=2527995 RepID=UPI00118CB443|nr:hypothetical protein [Symmachiella dynata]QDT46113.1 hypothetical protein Pan258_01300 [Symmachiella dynata]
MQTDVSTTQTLPNCHLRGRTGVAQFLRHAVWGGLLLLCGFWSGIAFGQDDDGLVEGDAPQPVAVNRFQISPEQFDQWVFRANGNARQARKRLDSQLTMRMNEIHRICSLDQTQKQKLSLAAAGDIKRFYDDVEKMRAKFMAVRNDRNAFGNIWQEIQPLQQKVSSGLFESDSLFHKTIRGTLTPQQRVKYDRAELKRRNFRFNAQVAVAVSLLERRMPLTEAQRSQLIKLISEVAPPPLRFGRYDQYVVWYFASQIPEATVKKILDEAQWEVFKPQVRQGKGMQQTLRREGYIP